MGSKGHFAGEGFCFSSLMALILQRTCRGGFLELLSAFPVVHLLLGLVARAAVALLDLAHQLVAAAFHLVELVVGELAPLLLHAALHLLPVALDGVPVHVSP